MKKIKVICTIGPSSINEETLLKMKDRGVNFLRINLSHTPEDEIEPRIKDLIGCGVPIILDTEGSQIRSGNESEIDYTEGSIVRIHKKPVQCDSKNLFLTPIGTISKLSEGDLISIEFNTVLLRAIDTSHQDYIECHVIIPGKIGGRKAVQVESPTFTLPPFSTKDFKAIELAKKYNINHFTLSFMESPESVLKFKKNYPNAIVYSKIESKKGLENFIEIAEVSDGILIDRGDLSNQVPLEKIPFVQKLILKKVAEMRKEAFVATNTLEQMAFSLKPNKAEINDIINILIDGATGIAMTKETAVGKYPVESVNMMKLLIEQFEFFNSENLIDSISENLNKMEAPEMLVKPHGGILINRFFPKYNNPLPCKTLEINEENLMDLEQIGIGSLSPLEGFMNSQNFYSVIDDMRLSEGIIWPLPITINTDQNDFKINEDITLTYKGEAYGILHLEEIYEVNKKECAKKIFGTDSIEHPGVKSFLNSGKYFLGGKITLIKRRKSDNKIYELTPNQTRKIFSERGWRKVVGFHTRNVIHRGHEFIQLEGLKKGLCDGLFIHPIIGKKKSGDFESDIIIKSYEKMIEKFYSKSKVILGTFANYSRYAGPREALFTALVRKNFGCSHFIVGRDHTGVGNFYAHNDSHKVFEKFPEEEIGIKVIKFDKVFFSSLENKYIHHLDFDDLPEEYRLNMSGTEARKMLMKGIRPPEWFMRPEISDMILEKIKNNEKVFVNEISEIKKAKILWFTGLSGSGKTTIANILDKRLKELNKKVKIYDGDVIRRDINFNLGFTHGDIKENNRRVIELCKKEQENYDFIIVPIISPFKESRNLARKEFGKNLIEVFVNCSYEECKKKDVKGLYNMAEKGEIQNFVGLHIPYEPPENPEIEVNTEANNSEECINKIVFYLKKKELI
ncbi:sulfate adenylyltransferase [Candidatus Pacearchaeota archaeon CG10_big_fil_rev_8_21_14_0_10_34_12]|nr:MAG: sulfate adenylyltransferase [Candidatus Pacearchaeota archaeon CG10_big_fil_rev_8_21_14_0_10_34_12]